MNNNDKNLDVKKPDLSLIDLLGSSLSTLAQEQVTAREPKERQWIESIRQYQGKYGVDEATKDEQALNGRALYADTFVNATRSKTNAGESVIGDLLFPNDQKNWGISATPVPELEESLENEDPVEVDGAPMQMGKGDEAKQITEGDLAKRAIEISQERALAMEKIIEDQFVECDYHGNAREAIHWAAILGTGIIKGAVVETTQRKKWEKDAVTGQWYPNMVDERVAAAKHVSPFHVYPDMTAAKKEEIEFIFEVSYPTRRQVQDLQYSPGIILSQLVKVLEGGLTHHHLTSTQYQEELRAISGLTTVITANTRYEMWSYRGEIEFNLLVEVGLLKHDAEKNELKTYFGVVWFIGSIVVKVRLNPDGFEPFPYHFYSWERDHASIFGYGVPYLMGQSQRVINVAWRQMLDNSSNTAGGQIVIDKSLIEPEDGKWEIRPFKVWQKKRATSTVRDAFATFSFDNHQNEIAAIYQLAQQISDEESGIPKLAEGQQGKLQTLGEASMQQNNANNDTRRRVREWDDNITKPLLNQFYDWNMRYNKNDEAKGDFKIKATGSSTLLAREQNQQALIQVATQLLPNPQFAPFIKTEELLKKLMQSLHLEDKSLVRTVSDVRAIQDQQKQSNQDNGGQQEMSAFETAKLEVLRQEVLVKQDKNKVDQLKVQSIEKVEYIKLAQVKEITLAQLEANLKKVNIESKVDLHKFNTEVQLKLDVGQGI